MEVLIQLNKKMKRTIILISILSSIIILIYFKEFRRIETVDIQPLKVFAINCIPCEGKFQNTEDNYICVSPPIVPENIIYILKHSKINDEYKKSVLLIFLKLYTYQLKNYHQSFELRDELFIINRFKDKNILLKSFCEIVGKNFISKITGGEYIDATYALEYLDKYPKLKNEPYIKLQLKSIQEEREKWQ